MRLRLGRVRSALIVAPHPDDEVIGAFGLIRSLRAMKARIEVLIVTDGAASHTGSRAWPRDRLAARRLGESRAALRRLGLDARHLSSLGLPDGALPTLQARLDRMLAREVARRAPDLVVGPCDDDDHADHRAVALSFKRLRTPARRLAYPVWPVGSAAACPLSHPFAGGAAAKRSVVRCHRSQVSPIADDPGGFTLSSAQFTAFTRGIERYRELRR